MNEAEKKRLLENLGGIQFGDGGYCPACGGWNADPKDPDRGCTPRMHTKDCWLAAAISESAEGDAPK